MNSYTFMGIDLEGEEEATSRKKTFIKRAIAFIKRRRQANRLTRNNVIRDRSGAHDPGMLGSLDCTDWEWFGCPYAFKVHYVKRDHGPNSFILLKAVASQDLWIWHAFFGVARSNNDINILYQSPLFNDLKTERAPEIPFVANGVTYRSGYYLVDGIYPKLAPLVKTIPKPADDDHKRIL
uniref:Protein ALP1-like n=1 Tax=Tanacetum cinerariifolium TaxID=118510 RepID=A0A6L2ML34_TANCI|nr:hypothetical protein [Tanacetum cinerariifolium]